MSSPVVEQRLISGSVGARLFHLAWPSCIGLLAVFSFTVADTFFVARLGTDALAALSYTFPVTFAFIALAIGLGIGSGANVARAIGQGRGRHIRALARDALLLAFLVGLCATPLGIFTIDSLFRAMGAEEHLIPIIRSYMVIWYLSAVLLIVPMVGNNMLRATGRAFFPGCMMFFAAMLNIILDAILIFGWWGVPAFGVQGAAMATAISRLVLVVVSLSYLLFRVRLISLSLPRLPALWLRWKKILRTALPASLDSLAIPFGEWVFVSILSRFGTEAVATYGIVSRLQVLVLVPAFALSMAMTPFAGQNWGAGTLYRILQGFRVSAAVITAWFTLVAVMFWTATPVILGLFTESAAILAWGRLYLDFVPLTYIGIGLTLVLGTLFYGIERPLYALILQYAVILVWMLLAVAAGVFLLDVRAVFLTEALANGFAMLLCLWVFLRIAHLWEQRGDGSGRR